MSRPRWGSKLPRMNLTPSTQIAHLDGVWLETSSALLLGRVPARCRASVGGASHYKFRFEVVAFADESPGGDNRARW